VSRRPGALAASAARSLVLLVFGVFFVVPLAWLVLAPTKSDDDLLTRSPLAVGNLHNVLVAWRNMNAYGGHIYRRWMENSLLYSLSATAIAIAVALPAGYGLAVGTFRGRKLVLSLTLIAMLIPPTSLVLPIYLELNAMRLIGNAFSIILPFAFFPFGVFISYLYFATALPRGLLDAARIDGCTELQAFLRVALPLAKPVAALVFFFSFVADWNNFFLPYAILPDQTQFPVQVGLTDIFRSSRPTVALATLIAALPVAVVFILSQRALVRGVGFAGSSDNP
jgi:multiple sugar transport system permease protein